MLLNRNGFWLLHSDPEKEWGFMFKEREKVNFANIYPEEWQEMSKQKAGQFYTEKGLFTFATIYPLQDGFPANTDLHATEQADAEKIAPSQHYWIDLVSGICHCQASYLSGESSCNGFT